jgi:hypothetical protein
VQKNRWTDRSQIHECRDWERGRVVSILGIFVSKFRYSAFAKGAGEVEPILTTAKKVGSSFLLLVPQEERNA